MVRFLRHRHLRVKLVTAFFLAAVPPVIPVHAVTYTTHEFVVGTYAGHTSRGELLAGLAKSRGANAAYLGHLDAMGTTGARAEADHLRTLFDADDKRFSALPDGPVTMTIPVIFVRHETLAKTAWLVTTVTALATVYVDTMWFSEYAYDTPYGAAMGPITNFVSNDSCCTPADGNSPSVNYDLLHSLNQPWSQSASGSYANEVTLQCSDTASCWWGTPDYSVTIGADYGGSRLHARLWGYPFTSSDGHQYTISDAHQDLSCFGGRPRRHHEFAKYLQVLAQLSDHGRLAAGVP